MIKPSIENPPRALKKLFTFTLAFLSAYNRKAAVTKKVSVILIRGAITFPCWLYELREPLWIECETGLYSS